jgi:hypothetical protein
MIELLAFTKLLELGAQRCDHRSARAEDEFYRSFGTSRIERLAARLLAYRPTKKGRDVRDPSTLKTVEMPIRRRCASDHGLRPETHRCGTAGSAS